MKSSTLLRIAFGFVIFHLLGHTVGHFTWKETEDRELANIIEKMDTHSFEFMGKAQTIGGHHEGYSWIFFIMLIMLAILLWSAANRIKTSRDSVWMLMSIGFGLIAFGIVEFIYFFPLAGASSLIAGLLTVTVWLRDGRS